MVRKILITLPAILGLASCFNSADKNNELAPVLAADREAQLGWVVFKAFPDSTFRYSLSSRSSDQYSGTFKMRGDTLFLTSKDTTIGIDTVVVRERSLEFLGKRSPRVAAISINKINKQ